MPENKGFFRPEEVLMDYLEKLNDPGRFPFTRGIYPTMYRVRDGGKKPTVRQFAGHGLADDTNERFKKILSFGGTGLSTAFDLPTLMGRDSDDSICRGQVGWDGVAVDTVDDMFRLFSGIAIDKVSVSMTINAPAAIILAMYIAAAESRNIPVHKLGGTIQNDILKEYIAQKEWLFPVDKGVRLVTDTIEFCSKFMPKWHPVSISGYHIREAGSSAVQEAAYTIADGIAYVNAAIARGLEIDTFAPQLSFFFDVHNDFFAEIAKIRAARRIWARIMKNLGANDIKSLWCRIHAQTAGCTLTRKEPMNNIVRVAYQALAALLAGAQSIHTNSFDEVVCTPTEKALKIAIRTQQILLEETEIADWIDPLAGSWLVESMTDKMESEIMKEIEAVRLMGGMEKAVEEYYPQSAIHAEACRDQRRVELGERKIIGVNLFREDAPYGETDISEIVRELETRKGFEERQRSRLHAIKEQRSSQGVRRALDAVKSSAESNENIMPALIDAVKNYATIGEISKAVQSVWGEYKERQIVSPLHSRTEISGIVGGRKFKKPVRIVLAKGGLDGHTRGLWIMSDLFRTLGAEVIYTGIHASVEEIAKTAIEEDADIIGLSVLIGSPTVLFSSLHDELSRRGRNDILITGGGIILPHEERYLKERGIGEIFPPDTPLGSIIDYLTKYGGGE